VDQLFCKPGPGPSLGLKIHSVPKATLEPGLNVIKLKKPGFFNFCDDLLARYILQSPFPYPEVQQKRRALVERKRRSTFFRLASQIKTEVIQKQSADYLDRGNVKIRIESKLHFLSVPEE